MSIIAGVTIDWDVSPRVIHVPIPITDVDIADLQNTLINIEDTESGIVFPYLRKTSGGEDLGGSVSVGWTMELQDAQVQFQGRVTPEETGACTTSDATGTVLHATSGQFVINGISRGDIVYNYTDSSMATILTVESDIQLTCQPLDGGTLNTWTSTDSYAIYPNVKCTISGGNLVAVDGAGNAISPILGSPNTDTTLALSSSATQVQSATSGLTAEESTKLDELYELQGLESGNPMTVTTTSRTTNNVSQTISGDGQNTTTVTRN